MSSNDQDQPYNDPYYYQDPSAYQNQEGYTGYDQQGYDNSGSDSSAYAAPPQQPPPQRLAPPLQQLQRIQSGIPGFDQIVGGGLIRDRVYLLSGPAGAGKTIFSSQFLYNGLTKYGENGVYVVLEEGPQQLRENMYNSFGWDMRNLEESGNLIILDAISSRLGLGSEERWVVPRPFTLEALLYEIQTAIQTVRASRVIIDSLDAMSLELTQVDLRSLIQRLTMILKSFGCTTLLVSGQAETNHAGRKAVEEYVVDGMIRLHHALEESVSGETLLEQNAMQGNSLEEDSFTMKMRTRKVEIPKMRGSSHSHFLHPFIIGENGVEVRAEPEVTKRLRRAIFKAKQVD
ncbi:MAG: ATPase domain-containing protein [Thermoproteota archaeon]